MAKRAGSALRTSDKELESQKSKPIRARNAIVPTVPGESRLDGLIRLIDHCTAAKAIADGLDEKFLSYMLAMAIQEARSSLRPSPR